MTWLRKHLEADEGDLVREMVQAFAEQLMAAEAQALCGAGLWRGEPRAGEHPQRLPGSGSSAPGPGRWSSRSRSSGGAATSPTWLFTPRRRAEQALTQFICQCYVEGVSTRRVDDVVKAMGIERISKSQVSELAKDLDRVVEQFRTGPLDTGPYTYLWLDALTQKVRP